MEGVGHGRSLSNGRQDQRGQERGRSASRRDYVPSAIGSSDILSSGDDGPKYTHHGPSSEGSQTQSSRTSHNHTASTSKKSKRLSFGRKPRAEVSWADKKSMDADKYTFFRDPTPPPTIAEAGEKPFTRGAAAETMSESTYDYRYDHVAPPAPLPRDSRRCGMRKRTFWIVLAAVLIALVIAVGVGVGVGVSSSKSSSESESDDSSGSREGDSDSTSDTKGTATSSSSSETTSTEPARTTTTSRSFCPAANDTVYSVPGSDKTFLRVCGIDYSGEFGGDERAQDIGVVITKNMEDCIVNCAGYPGCTGCGWGVIQGDEGSDHRCWLKSQLGKSHVARPGWDFAILQ